LHAQTSVTSTFRYWQQVSADVFVFLFQRDRTECKDCVYNMMIWAINGPSI